MDYPEEGFSKGNCIIYKQKYKDRKFFISWFNGIKGRGVDHLSINSDKSGYLLMELSDVNFFIPHHNNFNDYSEYRNIFFFDDEGRGLFDNINDKYEKNITFNKKYSRHISISTAIKINNDNEYKFLLNFEYFQGNFELINLKTGESTIQNIKILLSELYSNIIFGDKLKINPSMFFLELKKENHYLLGLLNQENVIENRPKGIYIIKFKSISTEEKPKIDINSFNIIKHTNLLVDLLDSRISCIELKNGNIALTYLKKDNYLYISVIELGNYEVIIPIYFKYYLEDDYFFKLIFLKDQKGLILFSDDNKYRFFIVDFKEDKLYNKKEYFIDHLKYEGTYHYSMDIMAFSETKIIIISQKFHGLTIIVTILDFFMIIKHF